MVDFLNNINSFVHPQTAIISASNPLLVLAVILITGFIFTKLAKKFKVPSVTAQIVGGIIIGQYVLHIFPESAYIGFRPITNFALGFIGLVIGSHLDFWKLHNAGKRIFSITIFDAFITPVLVFFALRYLAKLPWEMCLILAAISITTAPGSVLHIIRDKRAKGIFTKTILAVVALNNVITILVFYFAFYIISSQHTLLNLNIFLTLAKPILILIESIFIGGLVGFAIIYFARHKRLKISFLSLVILAIIVTVGISELLHISGILPSLILGIILTNFSQHKKTLFRAFKDIEKEVFTLFFVLAGIHLNFGGIKSAGYAGIIFILARTIGKFSGPTLGAIFASSITNIKKYIGISLYPIAGVAIGLVLFVENSHLLPSISAQITAIILTAVVIYELFGPIFTGKAIEKVGEVDKNRLRLMDFLQEEYIRINLTAKDKWEALDKMVTFMYKTHKIKEISIDNLKKINLRTRKKNFYRNW